MAYPTPRDPIRQGRDTRERIELLERRMARQSESFTLPPRLEARGTEIADWDLAIEDGWYWSSGTAANNPVGNIAAGHVMTYGPDGQYNRVIQEVWFPTTTSSNQSQTWRRVGSSNQSGSSWTWTQWVDIGSGVIPDSRLPARLQVDLTGMTLTSENLDDVVDTGNYVQTSNNNATAARNYPALHAGFLEVIRRGTSAVGVMQRYTSYYPTGSTRGIWYRTKYNSWGDWAMIYPGQWGDLLDKPSTFPPSSHSHSWGEVTGKPSTFPPSSHSHSWGEVTGKPSTFSPSSHTHPWSQITNPLVAMGNDVNSTAAPSSFIQGVSVNTAGSGFPSSLGTVLTVRQSGYRQFQQFFDRTAATKMFIRAANGDAAWQDWREVYTDGTPRAAFATAAGTANPAAFGSTVTLPSGRFTKPPIIVAGTGTQDTQALPRVTNVTASSFTIRMWSTEPGTLPAGVDVHWHAIQMTSAGASG